MQPTKQENVIFWKLDTFQGISSCALKTPCMSLVISENSILRISTVLFPYMWPNIMINCGLRIFEMYDELSPLAVEGLPWEDLCIWKICPKPSELWHYSGLKHGGVWDGQEINNPGNLCSFELEEIKISEKISIPSTTDPLLCSSVPFTPTCTWDLLFGFGIFGWHFTLLFSVFKCWPQVIPLLFLPCFYLSNWQRCYFRREKCHAGWLYSQVLNILREREIEGETASDFTCIFAEHK